MQGVPKEPNVEETPKPTAEADADQVGTELSKAPVITKDVSAGDEALDAVADVGNAAAGVGEAATGDFPGALLALGATAGQVLGAVEAAKSPPKTVLPPPPTAVTDPNTVLATNNDTINTSEASNAINAV